MDAKDEPVIEETTEDARQAENNPGMTSVLGLSITGVAIVFALVLGGFLAHQAGWF